MQWYATFVPAATIRAQQGHPDRILSHTVSYRLEMTSIRSVSGYPPNYRNCTEPSAGNASRAPVGVNCTVFVHNGAYAMHTYLGHKDEMLKMLDARVVASDPGNRSTWLPVESSFPSSAIVGGP